MSLASPAGVPVIPAGQPERRRLEVVRQTRRSGMDPPTGRLVHRATDSLSPEGSQLMVTGFAARKRYADIAADLMKLGEGLTERVVARAGARWRREQGRRLALAELNQQLLSWGLWKLGDLIELVNQVEITPGWPGRCRRRLWRAVRAFLRDPNRDKFRTVEAGFFAYWLSAAVVSKQRMIGRSGGHQ